MRHQITHPTAQDPSARNAPQWSASGDRWPPKHAAADRPELAMVQREDLRDTVDARYSVWQVAEQPSPLLVLPSSQVSPGSTVLLPHGAKRYAAPGPPSPFPRLCRLRRGPREQSDPEFVCP
jgi:hypothetical protein